MLLLSYWNCIISLILLKADVHSFLFLINGGPCPSFPSKNFNSGWFKLKLPWNFDHINKCIQIYMLRYIYTHILLLTGGFFFLFYRIFGGHEGLLMSPQWYPTCILTKVSWQKMGWTLFIPHPPSKEVAKHSSLAHSFLISNLSKKYTKISLNKNQDFKNWDFKR